MEPNDIATLAWLGRDSNPASRRIVSRYVGVARRLFAAWGAPDSLLSELDAYRARIDADVAALEKQRRIA